MGRTESGKASKGLLAYLTFTALVCGAMIMAVEVMGSRVVGPYYGVSLFVWTSLITVTMIALAAGYAIGGIISDRRGTPDTLYGIVLAAGLLVLLIPFVKAPFLKLCLPLGLRAGSLVSALLIFGPSLFLLGCVSPLLVKISTRELQSLGRTVGSFYAISTVGSVLGTILTGFWLIAWLGVDRIFQLVGAVLVLVALGWFVGFRRRWAALLFLGIPPLLAPPPPVTSAVLDNGTVVQRLAAVDDYYGSLKVLEYSAGDKRVRELVIDGAIQGGVDATSSLSTAPYPYFLQFLPYTTSPGGTRCLVVGLGPGVVPRWYDAHGVRCDVVDIDHNVVEYARTWFGYEPAGEVYIEDARTFLANGDQQWDYIILDVFTSDVAPAHLMSEEALQVVAARLAPNGVVGVNVIGSVRHETFMTASILHTFGAVFDQVDAYLTFDIDATNGVGNISVMAYQGDRREPELSLVAREPIDRLADPPTVHRKMRERFAFPDGTPAMVLTDEFNPVDVYDTWLREQIRRGIVEGTDPDILIGSG